MKKISKYKHFLEEVELTQQEFNEYILDETEAARHAFLSNSMYLG